MKNPNPIGWFFRSTKLIRNRTVIIGIINKTPEQSSLPNKRPTRDRGIAVELFILAFAIAGYFYSKLYL